MSNDRPDDDPTLRLTAPLPRATSGAAQAADILALGRAALDLIGRALRSSPEIRANRVIVRWPLDLEDVLRELELLARETPITELASRLGVPAAQLRSTALKLQRLALVKVSPGGLTLTATGRQKLARLEAARTAFFRRLAGGLESMEPQQARTVINALQILVDRADKVIDEQIGSSPAPIRRSTSRARTISRTGQPAQTGQPGQPDPET